MTSKLIPSNASQSTVIRHVTSNITTLSTPFLRFGLAKVGGRGTAIRLQSGGVAVFSPVELTPDVKKAVASLGHVKYIIAPDIEHHIFLGPWHREYPNAKVLGPEGLQEKRDKQGNEKVPFAVVFSKVNKDGLRVDPEFDADFDYEYVDSHVSKELVLLYRPERTIIQADLIFNLPATEQYSKTGESAETGIATKLMCGFSSTKGSALAQARFAWYVLSQGDREGFRKSMEKINQWDFDRMIPCHGDVIETGGKEVFRKVMQLFLNQEQR